MRHSAGGGPAGPGFDDHRGYETDLLTAPEAVEDINLYFVRRSVAAWEDIWLLPAGPDYDLAGGGTTVLGSRICDGAGKQAVVFTTGHIRFRQSLLVRTEDAKRLSRYEDLDSTIRMGVLAGTTGEARLLELTGLADAQGVLTAGVRVDTPCGRAVADGGAGYRIGAHSASPALGGRLRLYPPSPDMPEAVQLADEAALIGALLAEEIDALARGEIGNRHAARAHGGALVIGAVDERAEVGGFAVAADDTALAACLNWPSAGSPTGGGSAIGTGSMILACLSVAPGSGGTWRNSAALRAGIGRKLVGRIAHDEPAQLVITMHQIVDGAAVKDGEECRLRFGKNALEDAARLDPAAAGSPRKALGERDAPFHQSRHGAHGDRLRRPRQPQAATPAAHGFDEPGAAERPDDPGQVAVRDPVARRDLGDGGKAPTVHGELHQHAECVVGSVGQPQRSTPPPLQRPRRGARVSQTMRGASYRDRSNRAVVRGIHISEFRCQPLFNITAWTDGLAVAKGLWT